MTAKDSKGKQEKIALIHISAKKKTSIGKNKHRLSTAMMNKSKRRNLKTSRGQGRP
jgi:hypothetical protein